MTRTPQSTKDFATTAYKYNRLFNHFCESLFRHAAATQPNLAFRMAANQGATSGSGAVTLWAQSRSADGRFRLMEIIDEIEDPIVFAHLTDWLAADGRPQWIEPLLRRFKESDNHRITFAALHRALRFGPGTTHTATARGLAENEATERIKATLLRRFLATENPIR